MLRTIREFGLEHHTLPVMLKNMDILLRTLTLNVDPRNKSGVSFFSYLFLAVTCVLYHYIYEVSMVWFVFVRCKETGDTLAAIIILCLGLTSHISYSKLYCLLSYRNSLRKLFGDFLACDIKVLPNSRFEKVMKKNLRSVKKKAIMLWSGFMLNGIVYCIKPFFGPERQHFEENFEFLGFGNMTQMMTTPYYEITFAMDFFTVLGICYIAANITAMFVILTGYVEAQMNALSIELLNLWQEAQDTLNSLIVKEASFPEKYNDAVFSSQDYTNINHVSHNLVSKSSDYPEIITIKPQNTLNLYIKNRLERIANIHSLNINLVNKIEGTFRLSIALEFAFTCTGLIVCFLGSLERTFIVMPFALMFVTVDCLTGQRIIDANEMFEKAVYDSKWENFDVTNRRIVLLILKNAQKGMKLSSGGVATLSKECLMKVLKSIYTAYAAIRSTMT